MNNPTHNSLRFWSICSGISLIIMTLAAGYAYGFAFSTFYVEKNTFETLKNIEMNTSLYYSGAFAWCLILLTDLIVTYGFYKYLQPFNALMAKLSGLLRLTYSVFLAIGIGFIFAKHMVLFVNMWSLGLVVFGLHLMATGIGVFYSHEVPNILAILLLIAGFSYSLINGLESFLPSAPTLAASLKSILLIPMTIGEISFGIWLLIKGGRSFSQQASKNPVQDVL